MAGLLCYRPKINSRNESLRKSLSDYGKNYEGRVSSNLSRQPPLPPDLPGVAALTLATPLVQPAVGLKTQFSSHRLTNNFKKRYCDCQSQRLSFVV
jgi:hypothetical protein